MAAPLDREAIQRQIAELQAKLNADQAEGGAIVHSVSTGRDFIGRDSIVFIQKVFNISGNADTAEQLVDRYLNALARELAGLPLGDIDHSLDPTRHKPLELNDVYVPLNTTLTLPEGMSLSGFLSAPHENPGDESESKKSSPVPALDALATHRALTLLGVQGSGKSSFGAHVLLALAETWQEPNQTGPSKLGASWVRGRLLPVRVVLRQFAEKLGECESKGRASDLWGYIADDLVKRGWVSSLEAGLDVLQALAKSPGVLFFLDGLDECGQGRRRERVMEAVEDLKHNAGDSCRFLLTARPYAWPKGPDAHAGVYALADFDENQGQIEAFIRGWYKAVVRHGWLDEISAASKRDELLSARHRPDLSRLTGNPLLLTLMATLHTHESRLPDDRADLYNKAVELLLLNWNKKSGADAVLKTQLGMPDLKFSDLRNSLEKLAFEVHGENIGHEGTADVTEHRLLKAFRTLLNDSLDKAELAIDYIDQRAGLLIGQGEKNEQRQFTFPHRTFQEYLAACHLALRRDFETISRSCARNNADHWRVVLQLAARVAGQYRGSAAADALIGRQSIRDFSGKPGPIEWSCALLAGEQLLEIGLPGVRAAEGEAIIQRVAGWLAAALPVHPDDGGLPARERAKAGDILARLGDPRFHGPDCLCLPKDDTLGFVEIPADPYFCIGTRPEDRQRVADSSGYTPGDDELNDTITPTPAFWIARFPVTVAQYRVSVEQTGVGPKDEDALRDPDTRPVRWLSWHEAMDYCAWLEHMLRELPELANTKPARLIREGWRVALPSELEWEKAARGGRSGAVYPWGDTPDPERANYDQTGIYNTAAAGCFPPNDYGLHDLAGNVWEWTRSLYGDEFPYPYDPADSARENLAAGGEVGRVVRGGAWSNNDYFVRCAVRDWDRPDLRFSLLGFRVVLVSAPVTPPRTLADSDL